MVLPVANCCLNSSQVDIPHCCNPLPSLYVYTCTSRSQNLNSHCSRHSLTLLWIFVTWSKLRTRPSAHTETEHSLWWTNVYRIWHYRSYRYFSWTIYVLKQAEDALFSWSPYFSVSQTTRWMVLCFDVFFRKPSLNISVYKRWSESTNHISPHRSTQTNKPIIIPIFPIMITNISPGTKWHLTRIRQSIYSIWYRLCSRVRVQLRDKSDWTPWWNMVNWWRDVIVLVIPHYTIWIHRDIVRNPMRWISILIRCKVTVPVDVICSEALVLRIASFPLNGTDPFVTVLVLFGHPVCHSLPCSIYLYASSWHSIWKWECLRLLHCDNVVHIDMIDRKLIMNSLCLLSHNFCAVNRSTRMYLSHWICGGIMSVRMSWIGKCGWTVCRIGSIIGRECGDSPVYMQPIWKRTMSWKSGTWSSIWRVYLSHGISIWSVLSGLRESTHSASYHLVCTLWVSMSLCLCALQFLISISESQLTNPIHYRYGYRDEYI